MSYNGWENRETWLVNLWFNPVTAREVDYIRETLESDFYDMVGESNIYTDMINFNAINWREIIDNLDEADATCFYCDSDPEPNGFKVIESDCEVDC